MGLWNVVVFLCVYALYFEKFREKHQLIHRENREKKIAFSHFPLCQEQIRSVDDCSPNVCVCVCRVRIRKMNQALDDMDDNGIKLKSKLNFILYFVF